MNKIYLFNCGPDLVFPNNPQKPCPGGPSDKSTAPPWRGMRSIWPRQLHSAEDPDEGSPTLHAALAEGAGLSIGTTEPCSLLVQPQVPRATPS